MTDIYKISVFGVLFVAVSVSAALVSAQTPIPVAATSETIATFHAEGVQVYECKADKDGKLAWQFREPIATLMSEGKTVGRHYAGPNWEIFDGSAVAGKVASSSPAATTNDIPWLKLNVTDRRGQGLLSAATTVDRINTVGGVATGGCEKAASYRSVPYSADYVFIRKAG